MKRAYVAGPYRDSRGEWYVRQNINEAGNVARELWKIGYAVFSPHGNTHFFGGTDIPDQVWLDGDFEWLQFADVLVLAPRWETSEGTKLEIAEAKRLGIPVYIWPDVPKPGGLKKKMVYVDSRSCYMCNPKNAFTTDLCEHHSRPILEQGPMFVLKPEDLP